MEYGSPSVFQCDSDIVKNAYQNSDNYLIEYDNNQSEQNCVIYFSSNDIYYPNSEAAFRRAILEQNKFEWYATRVPSAKKHIFIRDIQKQWYLTGVNSLINTPEKLLTFLKTETAGYIVTTLGSSAGGFAAVLFGSLLGARLVLSFNGQFQVASLLKTSNESINPVLFRFYRKDKFIEYFDVKSFMGDCSNIFYFYSTDSAWDAEQRNHIQDKNVNVIGFKTSHHGIPFLKCNLPIILNMPTDTLMRFSGNSFFPLLFSVRLIGWMDTVVGLFRQIISKMKNKIGFLR